MSFKYISAALTAAGILMAAYSGCFYFKGMATQILLNHVWEKSKRTNRYIPLWSGSDTYPVGKIRIDAIALSDVVLEGTDRETLKLGPAHISDSAMPGTSGNIAIAGHRDSFFRQIRNMKKGDIIELESLDSTLYFIVSEMQVSDPGNLHWIDKTVDNVITLITCYPFDYIGPAPMRYIVRGKLVKRNAGIKSLGTSPRGRGYPAAAAETGTGNTRPLPASKSWRQT